MRGRLRITVATFKRQIRRNQKLGDGRKIRLLQIYFKIILEYKRSDLQCSQIDHRQIWQEKPISINQIKMKITSSILVLLLVSVVASLSLRSHNANVLAISPNFPDGEVLGELTYTDNRDRQVKTEIISGSIEEIRNPAVDTYV